MPVIRNKSEIRAAYDLFDGREITLCLSRVELTDLSL